MHETSLERRGVLVLGSPTGFLWVPSLFFELFLFVMFESSGLKLLGCEIRRQRRNTSATILYAP